MTSSLHTEGQYSVSTLASNRSVSRSSTMFEPRVVTRMRNSDSIGWYTYLTLSVSTKVCCLFDDLVPLGDVSFKSLGNADSSASMRMRVISLRTGAR